MKMIKHHPKFELLQGFVDGDLPASLAAGIAIHAELCSVCQEKIDLLTEQIAQASFEDDVMESDIDNINASNDISVLDFEQIIGTITASNDVANTKVNLEPRTITFKNVQYTLPNALRNVVLGKTAQIGKLSRARINLSEGEIHTNLLHIGAGGSIPEHTHKGFELTLLLEGTFSDHQGNYVKGDFIMLDKRHQHQPATEQGCLCYTVANDAMHFTQGINKLLNPIGAFIY